MPSSRCRERQRATGRKRIPAVLANSLQERPALDDRERDVVMQRDLHVSIAGLGPPFHLGDGVNLHVEHEERNPGDLQLLRKACVVDVIVGR